MRVCPGSMNTLYSHFFCKSKTLQPPKSIKKESEAGVVVTTSVGKPLLLEEQASCWGGGWLWYSGWGRGEHSEAAAMPSQLRGSPSLGGENRISRPAVPAS